MRAKTHRLSQTETSSDKVLIPFLNKAHARATLRVMAVSKTWSRILSRVGPGIFIFIATFSLVASDSMADEAAASVFPACKGAPGENFVFAEENCSSLAETLSITGIQDARDAANSIVLMKDSARAYRRNLDINVKYYQAIQKCYSGNESPDCIRLRQGFQDNLKSTYTSLRRQLAVSRGNTPDTSAVSFPQAHINRYMQGFNMVASPGSDHGLAEGSDEYKQALADLKIDAAVVDQGLDKTPAARKQAWQKQAESHQGKYLLDLVRNPHFMYLAAPAGDPPNWSDKQIQTALGKLITDVNGEMSDVDRVLQTDKLEFNRYTGASFWYGGIWREKSLLDFIDYPGAVNEALMQHPGLCPLALKLHRKYDIEWWENAIAIQGATWVLTAGVGKVAQALGSSVVSASVGAKLLMNAAMGGAVVYSGASDFNSISRHLMGDIDASAPSENSGDSK